MKFKIKHIEEAFRIKLKKHSISLGLDTASKTGYCIATTNSKSIILDIGFINIDVKGIKDKVLRNELRYEELYTNMKKLIKKEYTVVIENVFHSFNAQTTILLARMGGIAWTLSKVIGCKIILWKTATQARKALGLKCNVKKIIVMQTVNTLLGTKITNGDEIDAIVLALNGLIEV